jgi:hypothetical protein
LRIFPQGICRAEGLADMGLIEINVFVAAYALVAHSSRQ